MLVAVSRQSTASITVVRTTERTRRTTGDAGAASTSRWWITAPTSRAYSKSSWPRTSMSWENRRLCAVLPDVAAGQDHAVADLAARDLAASAQVRPNQVGRSVRISLALSNRIFLRSVSSNSFSSRT